MRVLISVISFRYLTGAELYVYELARSLSARGHDVTVVGQAGGVITDRARSCGVTVHDFGTMPEGLEFDVLHVQELAPAQWAMERHPATPVIATVHSQWPCETPLIDPRIHKYICIRPEVRDKVIAEDGIPPEKTAVVYNGVDFDRFRPSPARPAEREMILFAGTVDPLRREAALHLIERSQEEDFDVRFIGKRHSAHLDGPLPPNVSWIPGDVWDIERHVAACSATAGIVLGRTTLEGWACGKPGWIYDVDLAGRIRGLELHAPPPRDLLVQFDIEYMTNEIELLYLEAVRTRRAAGPTAGGVPTVLDRAALSALDALAPRPVALDFDESRFAVICFAEEVVAEPGLLTAWADEFSDDPAATLVIYAKGADEATWTSRVETALATAGLAHREDLDLLLVVAGPGDSMHGARDRLSGALTSAPDLPPALAGLPVAGAGDLDALRLLVVA